MLAPVNPPISSPQSHFLSLQELTRQPNLLSSLLSSISLRLLLKNTSKEYFKES